MRAGTASVRRVALATAALAVASLLPACGALIGEPAGSGGGGGTGLTRDATFTKAVNSDPGSLDPLSAQSPAAREVIGFLYESMLSVGSDGKVLPWLATSWTSTSTRAVFTLRRGVTCSDGSPLTARTVAANINYSAQEKNASFYFGAQVKSGTRAVADDTAGTVTVSSARPDPFLATGIGLVLIVCDKGLAAPKSLATTPDGTGTYVLDEVAPQDHYTLRRRADWSWGPRGVTADTPGLPKTVILRVIPDESTATNLLLSGELNAAAVTGPDQVRVQAAKLFSAGSKSPVGEMMFNEKAGRATADVRVREALSIAIDRAQVSTVLTDGHGTEPSSLTTLTPYACVAMQAPWTLPDRDVERARQLLDQAGWRPGSGGVRVKDGRQLSITFLYDEARATAPATAELVSRAWQQIGVRAELRSMNSASWSERLYRTSNWDAGFISVWTGFPDFLASFFAGATPPDGNNFMFVDNPQYASLVQRAAAASPETTCALWQQADTALVERFDVVPIADLVESVYGNHATFANNGLIEPTTIRVHG